MKRSVDLVIVAIVLTHAAICAGEPASQPARYKNIRQVDWKNFNYPTGPTTCDLGRDCGDEPLKVVNGTTEHSCASGSDLYLNPIEFGDVTGDDGEEAVVSFSVGLTNTGRMISTSCTFLYALRDELPIVVWAAGPLGVQSVHLGKRTFSFDVFRSRKESERHTYGGTPDFKLTLLKKEKVKAGSKPPSKEPDPQAQPASGPAVKTIRQVDWKNFTYPILPMDPKHCPGSEEASKPGSVTLKNGKNEKMGASFGKVVYVDVTGDKAEEAFVTVAVSELPDCLRGPDAPETNFYLYTLVDGRPTLVWQGGPQVMINSARVKKRALSAESSDGRGCLYSLSYAGTPGPTLKLTSKKKLKCVNF